MPRPALHRRLPHPLHFAALALVVLLAACASLPFESVDGLMKEGQNLYQAKQYDPAIARFERALALDARHWPAHLWIARARLSKSDLTGAIASARRALELAPADKDATAVLAESLLGAGRAALGERRYQDAIGYLYEYIRIQPGNARAYLDAGKALLGEKRFADALKMLVEGLKHALGAERAEAIGALLEGGRQAFAQGRFGDAIGFLGEYLRLDPANVRAMIDLARSYLETGALGEALSALVRALGQASGAERGEILNRLLEAGRKALSDGRAREAVGFLREYLRNDSGSLQGWLELGKAYWQAGERFNALDAFRRVLQLDPKQLEALQFLGGGR